MGVDHLGEQSRRVLVSAGPLVKEVRSKPIIHSYDRMNALRDNNCVTGRTVLGVLEEFFRRSEPGFSLTNLSRTAPRLSERFLGRPTYVPGHAG